MLNSYFYACRHILSACFFPNLDLIHRYFAFFLRYPTMSCLVMYFWNFCLVGFYLILQSNRTTEGKYIISLNISHVVLKLLPPSLVPLKSNKQLYVRCKISNTNNILPYLLLRIRYYQTPSENKRQIRHHVLVCSHFPLSLFVYFFASLCLC